MPESPTLPPAVIVEDNESVARVFKAAVERAGFATTILADGQTAIEQLAALAPRLIVLDLHLPFRSGRDVLHYIRQTPSLVGSWVILATADVVAARELERDVDYVLVKPCGFIELNDLAKNLRARLDASVADEGTRR